MFWGHSLYQSSKLQAVRYAANTSDYNFSLTAEEQQPDATLSKQ
jgi:hypothetical protein